MHILQLRPNRHFPGKTERASPCCFLCPPLRSMWTLTGLQAEAEEELFYLLRFFFLLLPRAGCYEFYLGPKGQCHRMIFYFYVYPHARCITFKIRRRKRKRFYMKTYLSYLNFQPKHRLHVMLCSGAISSQKHSSVHHELVKGIPIL